MCACWGCGWVGMRVGRGGMRRDARGGRGGGGWGGGGTRFSSQARPTSLRDRVTAGHTSRRYCSAPPRRPTRHSRHRCAEGLRRQRRRGDAMLCDLRMQARAPGAASLYLDAFGCTVERLRGGGRQSWVVATALQLRPCHIMTNAAAALHMPAAFILTSARPSGLERHRHRLCAAAGVAMARD